MPKDVDPAIVKKLDVAIAAAVKDPEFITTMAKTNAPIRYFGPKELAEYIQVQEGCLRQS
jgi:tripartite-type tricarboxylate transporter receptor subunit TctC